ncbi:MAG: ROK family transcriptional regulator [Rikenellaceae bacterium]
MSLRILQNNAIKRSIFKCILNNGNMSIPSLAKNLDISVPTMTKYVSELCNDGLLSDHGKITTKEGRYPNSYGVNVDSFYFMGVDIRWFSLTIGIIDISGEFIEIERFEDFRFTNTEESFNEVCGHISNFISKIEAEQKIARDKIINMNINITGRINSQSGYSYSCYNFGEIPLADLFTERLGVDTIINNDSRAMTYGEYIKEYLTTTKNLLFINIGWGLGMGVISEGKLLYGKSGFTGEIGHMNAFDNGIMCHCGKKGCVETEVSGLALHREIVTRLKNGEASTLSQKFNQGDDISLYDIVDAITEQEDMLCIEELEKMADKLGRQIANLINIFNPEVVVLGGILTETDEYLLLPVKSTMKKYSLSLLSRDTEIKLSKLKKDAGITGACLLARDTNLL